MNQANFLTFFWLTKNKTNRCSGLIRGTVRIIISSIFNIF